MINLVIIIEHPDLGRRGTSTAFKAATDAAFLDWRARHLDRHFRPSAVGRYGGEYRLHRRRGSLTSFAAKLRAMSPEVRAKFYADRRKRANPRSARRAIIRNLDPENRVPLFQTGRLRHLALTARTSHAGPVNRRAFLTHNLPAYLHQNPAGTIHKPRAMRLVTAGENADFAKTIDRHINRYLNKNTKTQKRTLST